MRIRLVHTEKKVVEDETPPEILETTEVSNAELLASNRRLARIAYYAAALSLVLMIGFVWLSSYDTLLLDRRMSQMQADILHQMDQKLAKVAGGAAAPKPQPKYADIQVPAGAPRMGDANAKVTVVEFADFQCPFCGRFQKDVYTQLKKDYIDTGKISFVYLDFAFLGEESHGAAQAAKCAGEQGVFWEYHDKLFNSQKGENQGAFAAGKLKVLARGIVPNTAAFGQCVDSGKYAEAVKSETDLGRAAGVSATPTTIINGKLVVGALPYASFAQEIEAALAK